MKENDLSGLRLFNEKANRIEQLTFSKWLIANKPKIKISKNDDDSLLTETEFPDLEAIEAFALTFRFFIQNNEKSSFGRLQKVYEASDLPEKTKDKFNNIRKQLNDFWDSKSVAEAPAFIPYREVVDIVMYGNLSHATKSHKEKYDIIASYPHYDALLKFAFIVAARKAIEVIKETKELNIQVIETIEKKGV